MRRTHDPSCLSRRWLWLGCYPQQHAGDSRGLGRQRQLAAGDQIQLPRRAPDLQHDDAQGIAGQRVSGGPQRAVDIRRAYGDDKARIETELG